MNLSKGYHIKFLNNKGFSFVEVMIAAAVMGGLSLVMLNITKQQAVQTTESKITSDLTQMKAEIQSYLTSPAHCNANFYNKTSAQTNPTAIFKCTATAVGACHSTPGTGNSLVKIPVKTGTTWTGTGTSSNRVRVSALQLNVSHLTPIGATAILTVATLKVTFESKTLNTSTPIKSEIVNYNASVVYDGTKVIGCPKSLGSTVPY